MIDRERILELIPHQGGMCLWDAVDEWDAGSIVLSAGTHRDPDNPLRSAGRLRGVHLCEYGAQAMAVHGGLRAAALAGNSGNSAPIQARPGVLVALRNVHLHVARIDDLPGRLQCRAEILVESDDSQQYSFSIHYAGSVLAEGRAAVVLGSAP